MSQKQKKNILSGAKTKSFDNKSKITQTIEYSILNHLENLPNMDLYPSIDISLTWKMTRQQIVKTSVTFIIQM